MLKIEDQLLREFKRHYHRYSVSSPDWSDDFRWLALIQHHGGPTRLLDFSYSFYAGVYFALRHAGPTTDAGLWLVDHDGLWGLLQSRLSSEVLAVLNADDGKGPESARVLLKENHAGVMPVNPLGVDERMAVQQAVFLMPLDLSRTFQNVLDEYLGNEHQHLAQKWRLQLPLKDLREALNELQRMNLTELSLFPGVDGLARNLCNMVAMPHLFVRDDMRGTHPTATDVQD
jgi:hypothetical protein